MLNTARHARLALELVGLGGLGALACAPFGIWPAELVALAGLFRSVAGQPARTRAIRGLCFGVGLFAVSFAFVWHFTALGDLAVTVFEALFIALAAVLAGGGGRPGAFAGALVIAEWLRGVWPFGGVPVGTLALGQVGGPLDCLARLGGPLFVTFGAAALSATAMSLCSIPGALARLVARGPRLRIGWRVAACVALAGLCAATIAPRGGAPTALLRAAAVQGGGPRGYATFPFAVAAAFSATYDETRRVPPAAKLIVWPEDVLALDGPFVKSTAALTLERLARQRDATLLVGATIDVGATHFRNESVVLAPSGRVVATFEKVRPVPFGEFVPDRSLLAHLVDVAGVPRDEIPGDASGMVETPIGRLGVLISYETYFAARARAAVRAGASVLVVETNTASYATDQVPASELAASRLQAIAEGRDLLQAATVGYSAVVSPTGAVLERSALGNPGIVVADLALRRGVTIYEIFGDVPVLWSAIVLVGIGLVLGRRRRPARS